MHLHLNSVAPVFVEPFSVQARVGIRGIVVHKQVLKAQLQEVLNVRDLFLKVRVATDILVFGWQCTNKIPCEWSIRDPPILVGF